MADLDIGDTRIEFVAEYSLKSLKIKSDKWTKMFAQDENRQICIDFFDKGDNQCLILAINAGGGLAVSTEWPSQFKQKAVGYVTVHTMPLQIGSIIPPSVPPLPLYNLLLSRGNLRYFSLAKVGSSHLPS